MAEGHHSVPIRRPATMAAAGAAVEWYDFFLYGTAAALVFPKLFFPSSLPLFASQMAAFSTFAVGFLARPIGGIVFGHIGDTRGRKTALALAMALMGLSSTGIGLLPGYRQIGVLAPLLLVLFRFVQGLAVGGQWGGAALLAIESGPVHRRGLYGSFVQLGVPLGLVLANAVFLVASAVTDAQGFLAWGWRIGFLLSLSLVFSAGYLHLSVQEPGRETRSINPGPSASPLWRVLRDHWKLVLLAGGAFIANNVCFYIAITYVVAYGTATVGISRELLLFAVMFGSVAMIPVLIACGDFSDRYGRRGIFMAGAALAGIWGFAMFPLVDTRSPIAVTVAITVEMFFLSLMYGPQAALFAELFPRAVRYSGASLGYQIGAVAGGGLAPLIATALFAHYGTTLPISVYLLAVCMISFLCVAMLPDRDTKGSTAL